MYNGLFGDLPATNSSTNDTSDKHPKESIAPKSKPEAPDKEKTSKPKAASLFFVPSAARRQKRPPTVNKKPRIQSPDDTPFVLGGGDSKVKDSSLPLNNDNHNSEKEADEANGRIKTEVNVEKETSIECEEEDEVEHINLTEHEQHSHHVKQLAKQLGEDLYDPMFPNDVLWYWQHEKETQERERLEKEQEIALKAQQALERRMETQRANLARTGRIDELAQQVPSRGRGGRSNLPAWLVEQQKNRKGH